MLDNFPVTFLIGLRGSGKTTLAKNIAEEFSCSFIDTDALIQKNTGKTIEEIVNNEGWQSFRDKETEALYQSVDKANIISTGGGIILKPENCNFMRSRGRIFYLDAPCHVLLERLEKVPLFEQRPKIVDSTLHIEIETLYKERNKLYKDCAHHILDATKPCHEIFVELCVFLQIKPLKIKVTE